MIPEDVKNDPIWNDNTVGAYFHQSPQDQSTCNHLGTVMSGASRVVDGRCNFYEPFGRTNSWRILDADNNLLPEAGGIYYVAVFLQEDTSSKISIALGTWVEQFITPFDLDTPSCTRNLSDFSEKEGLQEESFPVLDCTEADAVGDQNHQGGSEDVCELGEVCESPEDCMIAGIEYKMPMMGACGGMLCPAAVQTWEEANMKMHRGMMDLMYTGDVEIDFVRGMIPHHNGAVDMCRVLLDELTCTIVEDIDNLEGLVHFCNHIELEQSIEVTGMRTWLEEKGLSEMASCSDEVSISCQANNNNMLVGMPESCGNLTVPSSEKLVMVNHKMHDLMAVEYSCDHSADFVRMMLPHHAGAVVMCDILVETTQDNYLIELCSNITMTQRAEIAWMSEWLEARDLDVVAPCGNCDKEELTFPTPCEDTLSTSSFCHGISGSNSDGYCRCDDATFEANNFTCDESSWIDGFGLFVPQEFCKRSCGMCPEEEDTRPLWVPGCSSHNDMEGHNDDMDNSGHMNHGDGMDHDVSTGSTIQCFLALLVPIVYQ